MRYILILLILCIITGTQAQDSIIPACSQSQMQKIDDVLEASQIVANYKTIASDMNKDNLTSGNLDKVIQNIDLLQRRWWDIVVPNFPDCAMSYRIQRQIGRLLDETLIFSMAAHWGYLELIQGQSATIAIDIMNNHVEMLDRIPKAIQ